MTSGSQGKIFIVGIGDDGIQQVPAYARQRIEEADLLIGPRRVLDMALSTKAERVVVGTDLGEIVRRIQSERGSRKIVVLASGDPLFYGVARFLCEQLGKELFEVVPHVSSMQLAFARVMESWDEAYLTDLSQRPLESVIDRIRTAEKVGLFTSEENSPPVIAKVLLDEGIDYFRVYVCENLGGRNEVVTQGSLEEIRELEFGPLNVMILIRKPAVPDRPRRKAEKKLFGNADDVFRQSRPKQGLLTAAEVRTLALAQLDVRLDSIVWDIGAGSGSVSIECAQLATQGVVHAIETDIEDCHLIADNAANFAVPNVKVVLGRAPDAFQGLPDPDCVFIGGTGRETVGIISAAFARLKPGGRIVANVASLEQVSAATETLKPLVPDVGLLMVNLARGTHQLQNIRFEALNPTFLVFGRKPA
ncbi:MAG: precorrin-6y C5,15-methyltransferase (decarboxylating) subunit CbiE [Planctomycetota bacterium]